MNRIKFALFTDLHCDIAPDGCKRLERFINRARKEDVDFIIELGDFSKPDDITNLRSHITM